MGKGKIRGGNGKDKGWEWEGRSSLWLIQIHA